VVLQIESTAELLSYIRDLAKSLFGKERFGSIQFELTLIVCMLTSSDTGHSDANVIELDATTTTYSADNVDTSYESNDDDETDQHAKRIKVAVDDNGELCPSVCTPEQFHD
jgi:hypothetical protein